MLKTISLNGPWEFRELAAEQGPWKAGTVPGCVQLDLLRLGEVPDPFYRLNEIEMHRLEEKEWVYRKSFEMTVEDQESDEIDLVFEGIDTIADLYLNGTYLGRAEDMFMPYRYDVSDIVELGENTLEVRFHSPLTTIKEMERTSPITLSLQLRDRPPLYPQGPIQLRLGLGSANRPGGPMATGVPRGFEPRTHRGTLFLHRGLGWSRCPCARACCGGTVRAR